MDCLSHLHVNLSMAAFGFHLSESGEVTEEGIAKVCDVLHVLNKQEIVDLEVNCSPIATRSLCMPSSDIGGTLPTVFSFLHGFAIFTIFGGASRIFPRRREPG
jgi:hypothetical protein